MSEHVTPDEPYLLVEEIAERLGLPLAVLLRRVEAGDVPSRRDEGPDGFHYALRLSDLGIETDESPNAADGAAAVDGRDPGPQQGIDAAWVPPVAASTAGEDVDEPDGISVFDQPVATPGPGVAPTPAASEHLDVADVAAPDQHWHGLDEVGPAPAEAPAPGWSTRPREPRQPPPWMIGGPGDTPDVAAVDEPSSSDPGPTAAAPAPTVPAPAPSQPASPSPTSPAATAPSSAAGTASTAESASTPAGVPTFEGPERRRNPSRGLLDAAVGATRGELGPMSLDARDLVAGLLDRWERTLEQRIYTEQRQRFQGELTARQNMVKQLQMELQTARAEHAAAQADKDRVLAEKERTLADRERELAEMRSYAVDTDHLIAPPSSARRRRWFRARDDG